MIRSDWIFFWIFLVILMGIIGFSEWLRKSQKMPAEKSRKMVHVLVGLLVALTPFIFRSMWPMIVLGSLFTILDYVAIKYHLLKAMHHTKRQSLGTVFYPISFVLLTVLLWHNHKPILVISMLIMAVSDAMAAVVGQRSPHTLNLHDHLEKKSLRGSVTMWVVTFFIVISMLSLFTSFQWHVQLDVSHIIWIAVIVSFMATACEMVSIKGSDNLTVPLGSALVMHYMLTNSVTDRAGFSVGMGLSLIAAFFSLRLRFLDKSGAIGAFILGTIVFGLGRWAFTLPMLTFFVLSSLLSKFGKKHKLAVNQIFAKSGVRDIFQVLANGGLGGLFATMWYLYPTELFYFLFIASLAAVTADTWATEIGVLSKRSPRSILDFKRVPKGASGGITPIGTLGAILGSFVLVSSGYIVSPHNSPRLIGVNELFLLVFSGFAASLADSLLGATVQAQYQCPKCQKITEKERHCDDKETVLVGGYRWINNDMVNIIAAFSGVLIFLLLWFCCQ
ncbi:DUF92 domain-containing protein [candidate division KSB1 bacterium]|nr:DUF92 domain-containing protein [candidate division KSB1 bacterium]